MRSAPLLRRTPLRAKQIVGKPAALSRKTGGMTTKTSLYGRGMKGSAPTVEQRHFHDMMAGIGCIACWVSGIRNDQVSIHHIDGRTKPDAHWKVLPLCAGHHQDGTGAPGLIAVHPYKARFEATYGSQMLLLRTCVEILVDEGKYVHPEALRVGGLPGEVE